MKVLIGIVTYNRRKMLESSLDSLKIQKFKEFDTLVINNNSTDDTKEFLEKYAKKNNLMVQNLSENTGGAGGFNLCVKYAIENGYDYAWLMDDDVIMNENTLEEMINATKILKNEFSFLSPAVKWTDNNLCDMNIPATKGAREIYADKKYVMKNIIPIVFCSFVGCFLNLQCVKKFGLPIKEFFIYYDDTEYTTRISKEKNGYWVLNSEVIHKMNNNTSMNIFNLEDLGKISRIKYDYRNRFYCAKREGLKPAISFFIKRYLMVCCKILFSKSKYKLKKLFNMSQGIFKGLFFNPAIEYVK